MPNRKFNASDGYRYGFNGKENDNEVKGEGNQIDYEARIFDPRISRWLSGDPHQVKYPFESPYTYTLNSPLQYSDQDGKDIILSIQPMYAQQWASFLNKTFEDQVEFTVITDNDGIHRLTLNMKKGGTFKSSEAKRAFDYLQGLANNHDIKVEIRPSDVPYSLEKHVGTTGVDDYQSGTLYDQVLSKHPDGFAADAIGTLFIHYMAEQEYVQNVLKLLPVTQRSNEGTDYWQSHEKALQKGLDIFKFQWAEGDLFSPAAEIKQTRILIQDRDVLDAEGNYQYTIRMVHDFSGKEPQYSSQKTHRKDIKIGDRWKPATDGTPEGIKEYFNKYPLQKSKPDGKNKNESKKKTAEKKS